LEEEEMRTEEKLLKELEACRECDVCRTLMEDSSCLVFNEMYRLFDKESETKEKITTEELQNLVELCNFCEICPCWNIRAAILEAKTEFKEKYGLNYRIRLLENVERIGKLGGAQPWLSNLLLQNGATGRLIKKVTGIHEERKIPKFPKHGFQEWAEEQMLYTKSETKDRRRVAYFAGCTGSYLFPDIPKAVVEVLQQNDIEVYLPEQRCCGMPSLLEGDRRLTLEFVKFNVERLSEVVEDGDDIVCSCPTCGYMLKCLIREGAIYSDDYQASGADDAFANMTEDLLSINPDQRPAAWFRQLIYSHMHKLLKDDQYFSSINGLKRMMVADNTYDLGEYLRNLHLHGDLNTEFGPIEAKTAYYPPCHLREQNIGRPYTDLLSLIPGIYSEPIQGKFHCCGNAGIMGFKSGYHRHSVKIGSRLKAKIRQLDPERLLTDCLSCRMQFNQITTYAVYHPIEIIKESYDAFVSREQREAAAAP
jgi:glycerol-3-phosphate dehydrogenase subunit C